MGSIFRTCDAVGVSKIILCGYTPAPVDRFGRENKGLVKASLGAENLWNGKRRKLVIAIQNLKNHFVRSQLLRKSRYQNDFQILRLLE